MTDAFRVVAVFERAGNFDAIAGCEIDRAVATGQVSANFVGAFG